MYYVFLIPRPFVEATWGFTLWNLSFFSV